MRLPGVRSRRLTGHAAAIGIVAIVTAATSGFQTVAGTGIIIVGTATMGIAAGGELRAARPCWAALYLLARTTRPGFMMLSGSSARFMRSIRSSSIGFL